MARTEPPQALVGCYCERATGVDDIKLVVQGEVNSRDIGIKKLSNGFVYYCIKSELLTINLIEIDAFGSEKLKKIRAMRETDVQKDVTKQLHHSRSLFQVLPMKNSF